MYMYTRYVEGFIHKFEVFRANSRDRLAVSVSVVLLYIGKKVGFYQFQFVKNLRTKGSSYTITKAVDKSIVHVVFVV